MFLIFADIYAIWFIFDISFDVYFHYAITLPWYFLISARHFQPFQPFIYFIAHYIW